MTPRKKKYKPRVTRREHNSIEHQKAVDRLARKILAQEAGDRDAKLTPELRGLGLGLLCGPDQNPLAGLVAGLAGIPLDLPHENTEIPGDAMASDDEITQQN